MKGAVTLIHLVGWGLTIALASVGYTSMAANRQLDTNTMLVQRMSVVETKSDNFQETIDDLNKKVDTLNSNVAQLMYALGVKPK